MPIKKERRIMERKKIELSREELVEIIKGWAPDIIWDRGLMEELADKILDHSASPKEHTPHTEPDTEHDTMTLTKLSEHLGVELFIAMEIARWASIRPKVEPKVCPRCLGERKVITLIEDRDKEITCPKCSGTGSIPKEAQKGMGIEPLDLNGLVIDSAMSRVWGKINEIIDKMGR